MSEYWLAFGVVLFDSSNKVLCMIEEKGYLLPHPRKDQYFMVEISGVKGASLLQSCFGKLIDLNFDKCSCSGVYNSG